MTTQLLVLIKLTVFTQHDLSYCIFNAGYKLRDKRESEGIIDPPILISLKASSLNNKPYSEFSVLLELYF